MTHPLVTQLWFARRQFLRGLEGVSAGDGVRRLDPMNCISWTVGHLAFQENRYWCVWAQGRDAAPGLEEWVGWGKPATCPPLDEMWTAWRAVTAAADAFLATLGPGELDRRFDLPSGPSKETVGLLLLRNVYHYWFHLGEAHAVRQMLGHPDLPQFVGPGMDGVEYGVGDAEDQEAGPGFTTCSQR